MSIMDRLRMARRRGEKKATRYMQRKSRLFFGLFLCLCGALGFRIYYITKENGENYKKLVLSQRNYSSVSLPYRRGDIVDAKGIKLAVSDRVYNLIIDARALLYKEKYLEPTLAALESCFELDMEALRSHLAANPESVWYVAAKRLSYEQIAPFLELEGQENSDIKGVWFQDEYKRSYPHGSLACDVIGFTVPDNIGSFGLEEYYNEELNGTDGRRYGYLNDDANLEVNLKPPTNGHTLHSTLDINIQAIVEKHLDAFELAHRNEAREGLGANQLACIIMDVNNGGILAMASNPVFDLNNPRDLSLYYTPEQIQSWELDGTRMDRLNQIWRNYCISDTYEPGSTIKPFTVASALDCGAITGGEVYQCNGSLTVDDRVIRCHTRFGDGAVTVQDSIAWSCNVALMEIAQAMGQSSFAKYQKDFGFGLKTNVDLAGEARTQGLVYTADRMRAVDLATNSFGQSFNVSMIQMISGFASLINGGYYYQPRLVDKITNDSGATVEEIEPRVLKQVISEAVSAKIRQYCRATVMEEGGERRTGRTARPAGYAIGGKTGTAQTLPRGNGEYIVSFMGFAPADQPQIAIYMVVDRPNVAKQDDAKMATTLVREILTEVLPYMGIYMTEPLSEEESAELEAKKVAVLQQYAVSGGDAQPASEESAEASSAGGSGAAASEAAPSEGQPEASVQSEEIEDYAALPAGANDMPISQGGEDPR